MFRLHGICGDLQRVLKTNPIARHRFEFPVSGSRVDLVLFHKDGGVSIVEFKGQNSSRDVVAGIGQLFLYEALFVECHAATLRPAYVHKYLVSPILGDDADKVDKACVLAGVAFLRYAPFKLIREIRNECRREWISDGPEISANAGTVGGS